MDNAKSIIFLGTGSDVGKSVTATAFCRILKNRGYRVAPFKAQNLSNNSFVTLEGGEIGRAQAAQAEAAGLSPSIHMNPVLLKPGIDMGSQVVVHGQVHANLPVEDYYGFKAELKQKVMESYDILAAEYDAIVMEGAGSCCEVNLREHDIVNFSMALETGAPAVIVADIDRGGVFAQIVGTMELISPEEREAVAGFIINKFRGDPTLFDDGIKFIEEKTGKPVFGLVPVYDGISIDTEDSMSLDSAAKSGGRRNSDEPVIRIAAVRLPGISNSTDLEPLAAERGVSVTWLTKPEGLNSYHAVILPGSKVAIKDTLWLKENGWKEALAEYAASTPGYVIGLCGGYQMLGTEIMDPHGIESKVAETGGIGLLDVTTEIEPAKVLSLSEGTDLLFNSYVRGYEIHMGRSRPDANMKPFIEIDGKPDGAVSENSRVMGTYLHGLFDSGAFRREFLAAVAESWRLPFDSPGIANDHWALKDENYNRLADHFLKYCDVDRIIEIMGLIQR